VEEPDPALKVFSGDKVVAVTGASGFLGRHLVASLHERPDVGLRVLVHRRQPSLAMDDDRIRTVPGDLLTPNGLDLLLAPDCTVIHLAYSGSSSGPENLKAASNLADACAKARIRRLVHCSTAVVAGRVGDDLINENTRCRPAPGYESTKFEMERIFAEKAAGRFELAILRPAAVFGPGGRNLLKMADDLKSGNRVMNYLKSCLFDQRPMNLVSVGHVVSALTFLAFAERKWNGDVFIVSDDDHPWNTYRNVEKYLMKAMGRGDYPVPRFPLPAFVLSVMLRIKGRSNSNPQRRYDAGKLRAAGFQNTVSFEAGLKAFADWYRRRPADPAIQNS